MSKYALKLEQLVQTDSYGDILITIQYDGDGPKIISANGEQLDPEVKHELDTVLGLVNFTLSKGITPAELSSQLEIEPQDGYHTALNDLLFVIASAVKEAPESIDKIEKDSLMEIVPEMLTGAGAEEEGGSESPQDLSETPQSQSYNQNYPQQEEEQQPQNQESDQSQGEEGRGGFFGGFNRRQ